MRDTSFSWGENWHLQGRLFAVGRVRVFRRAVFIGHSVRISRVIVQELDVVG